MAQEPDSETDDNREPELEGLARTRTRVVGDRQDKPVTVKTRPERVRA